ncbi:hypothetical protein PATSB16_22490 [Pandoraea thiooxydans]|nr:hypothetical protein PATSB16_22490 [Pandoraea thiooxydans]
MLTMVFRTAPECRNVPRIMPLLPGRVNNALPNSVIIR